MHPYGREAEYGNTRSNEIGAKTPLLRRNGETAFESRISPRLAPHEAGAQKCPGQTRHLILAVSGDYPAFFVVLANSGGDNLRQLGLLAFPVRRSLL